MTEGELILHNAIQSTIQAHPALISTHEVEVTTLLPSLTTAAGC